MGGALFVVATPIGNLEDISRRAERVLAEADAVVAEDTRRTRALLSHLGLRKPLISHYEPKEERTIPKILRMLEEGKDLALVTDGGAPAVSDPGYRLVRAAVDAGYAVIPVPGPSALTAALSAAGLPTDLVTFAGFLPEKSGRRKKALGELADRRDTLVLYESPRRMAALLRDALEVLGDRRAVMFRELTKMHEERVEGSLYELIERIDGVELKGEVTLLLSGASEEAEKIGEAELEELVREELERGDDPPSKLAAKIARRTGVPRKQVYELVLKLSRR